MARGPLTESGDQKTDQKGMLSLKDGRFFIDVKLEKVKGAVRMKLKHGDIDVADGLVLDYFAPGMRFAYEPKNDKEREKIAKGYIRFKGKWIKGKDAERRLAKALKDQRKKLLKLRENQKLRNMKVVKTKDFIFKHNLPEPLFLELKDLFETFLVTFKKKWRRKSELSRKPQIHFYANQGDYMQYTGIGAGALGFYNFGGITLHFYWDRLDPELTRNVLYHEATHLLVDMIDGDFKYPSWIEEGMAEYYGGSRWNPKAARGKKMLPGHMLPGRLVVVKKAMKEKKPMKLNDLMMTGRRGFGAVHYAWAWTFIHYLMSTKKYTKRFERYYIDLAHKKGIRRKPYSGRFITIDLALARDLFLKAVRVKRIEKLEKEWYGYINTLEVEDLAGMEAAGRRLRAFGEHKDAKKMLKEAIDKGAKNPMTYVAYADYLARDRNYKEAVRMIDHALGVDPLQSGLYFRKGELLRRMLGKKNKAEGARLIQLAAELDPWSYAYEAAQIEMEDAQKAAEAKRKKGKN